MMDQQTEVNWELSMALHTLHYAFSFSLNQARKTIFFISDLVE
jgi:hypothetical protein